MIFFGCIDRPGHYGWFSETQHGDARWFHRFDNVLAPRDDDPINPLDKFALHHLFDGSLTVLAFVDRTVDTRQGSNGAFIETGTLTRDEMIARAYEQFPNVAKRVGVVAEPTEEAEE